MLNEEAREQLAEILVNRIDDINSKILKEIGDKILAISLIKPSEAYQLGQILKYGGDFKKIAEELAKLTGKNVEDIYKIFEEVAKSNKQFAKEFYKYRNVEYIPYKKDIALQNQVKSIASITAGLYRNISRTTAVGYIVDGRFRNIQDTYNELIDKAIISIVQGKDSYYSSMRKTLTQLGNRGMVTYESGKTRRLDSAIRMNVMDGIRAVNNETNKRFGEEYGADGVEISVHSYPAPDHAEAQGRQLSNEEFDKLQLTGYAKDVKGRNLDLHLNSLEHRPISELNCYHEPFNIVIGISKPLYTDEQLKKIQEDNEKGFDFEGKHYTLYEGTQLQRRLELEAKKHKEATILLRAAGDKEGLAKEELKVRKITRKYNELNKASGLPSKKERMSVGGYERKSTKVSDSYRIFDTLNNVKDDIDYDKMIETNKNNISKETRETIYRTDWANGDRLLNEYGYINSSEGSTAINKIMRYPNTRKEYSPEVLKQYDNTIDHMKKAINSNETPENILVTRFVSRDWLQGKISPREFILGNGDIERDFNNIKTLKEVNEDSFLSTSLNYTPYTDVAEKTIKLNLEVDKGTHAFVTENKWESEIIFDKSNIAIEDVMLFEGRIIINGKLKKYKKLK